MKDYIKKIIPAVVIATVMSFMLFIYEPITLFISNSDDFWFGFSTLLKTNIVFFVLAIVFIILISIIVFIISRFLKKQSIYTIYLIILSSGLLFAYIQGNYFSGKLPLLDGSPIEWSKYSTQSLISYGLIIGSLLINILIYVKFKNKYAKIISYTFAAIFVMLCTGLIPSFTDINKIDSRKGLYASTTNDINTLSSDTNFLILLVDMLDSRAFDQLIKDKQKENIFDDFTYYPDTLSAYPFTRESIPFILTGKWYECDELFSDFYNDAFDNSKFFANLKDRNFDINIYEQDLQWTTDKTAITENVKIVNFDIDKLSFLRQQSKYVLFKYLPYSLKKYSKIETMNYLLCRKETVNNGNVFHSDNKETYDLLDEISFQDNNYFQFIHIDGGHYPWDINEKFEIIENGTYDDKMASALTVIEKYLNRIKESGQYDNSIIIILADHGNNDYEYTGRQNPSLYIKGLNEKHDKMIVSDKKVSYADLNDTIYNDLLNGKKSTEILNDVEADRIRRFIWYKDYGDMYEQILDGHAWETEKLINTGKRYK